MGPEVGQTREVREQSTSHTPGNLEKGSADYVAFLTLAGLTRILALEFVVGCFCIGCCFVVGVACCVENIHLYIYIYIRSSTITTYVLLGISTESLHKLLFATYCVYARAPEPDTQKKHPCPAGAHLALKG